MVYSEINSQPLLQGEFFDAPSPCIVPTSFSQECNDFRLCMSDESDGMFSMFMSEDSLSQGRASIDFGKFYESFANLLIDPMRGIKGGLDRHDANLKLQRKLPALLANMPEKSPGEIEPIINTLLGPPQFSAGICLLQVVVYLYSNDQLRVDDSDMVMKWIVDKIPLSNLITILKTKLPTLQEFQSSLLLFAIKNNLITTVKELLSLDGWMREMALCREYLYAAVRCQGGFAMTELILSSSTRDVKEKILNPYNYKYPTWYSIGNCISIETTRLLHHEGMNLATMSFGGETLLHYAITRGDVTLARYLISIGVGYPTHGEKKLIDHLVLAVWCERVDMVHILLESDFPVDGMIEWNADQHYHIKFIKLSVPYFPATAIQVAASMGNIEIVKGLVQAGANINDPACGVNGMTALQAAAEFNNTTVVQFLLQNGADVNAQGNTSTEPPRTALLVAIENNNIPLFDILLKHDASPNVPALSKYGTTILEVASVQKESSIFVPSLLARGADDKFELEPQLKARCMKLQLERAVFENNLSAVQDLVANGVTVDMCPIEIGWSTRSRIIYQTWNEDEKITILECALTTMKHHRTSDSSIFRYLIKHIVDINEQNSDNSVYPILQQVVAEGDVSLVNILLEAGANIDFVWNNSPRSKFYMGITALMTAILQKNLNMVILLLERGAEINLIGRQAGLGFVSPLQLSALWDSPDITKLLLSRGADFSTSTRNHEISFYSAAVHRASRSSFYMSVVKDLLPKVGVDERDAGLFRAAGISDLGLVRLFLDNGADINTIHTAFWDWEHTVLGFAAKIGHIKIAEFLLSRGAEVNLRIEKGLGKETALDWAAQEGKLDMVQVLLNHGADDDLPLVDRYCSPLNIARKRYHYGIVIILEKYRDKAMEE